MAFKWLAEIRIIMMGGGVVSVSGARGGWQVRGQDEQLDEEPDFDGVIDASCQVSLRSR